jgi:protein required for attachment to host cells
MKKVWVLVANSSQAKIYRANGPSLLEHGIFFHDESRMPARDLVSDNMGRETNRNMYGNDTCEPKTSLKEKEFLIFANTLAQFLEKGYNSGECEKIYVIAKPPFLGFLRQAFSSHVTNIVESEIHKDLTHMTPNEIREYLPEFL